MSDLAQATEQEETDPLETILEILKDHEQRLSAVCQAHEDLDKEIHEDFFGPIHEQYKASERGKGIEGLKGRYGAQFDDDLQSSAKAFGIDDLFSRLYDEIEKLKGGEGFDEKGYVDSIHSQLMDKIGMIRGKPKEAEKPASAVAVEVKKETPAPSAGEKLKAGKGRMSLLSGY